MASINKIILLGTVTTVPDFRVLAGGSTMVSLCLETTVDSETQSHDVTFFGRLGNIVMQYVTKGSLIYVEGALRSRQYPPQKGVRRLVTGIVAQKMQMLDRKKEVADAANDLFPKDNFYKKAKEGSIDPPDLSTFGYDDW